MITSLDLTPVLNRRFLKNIGKEIHVDVPAFIQKFMVY